MGFLLMKYSFASFQKLGETGYIRVDYVCVCVLIEKSTWNYSYLNDFLSSKNYSIEMSNIHIKFFYCDNFLYILNFINENSDNNIRMS